MFCEDKFPITISIAIKTEVSHVRSSSPFI